MAMTNKERFAITKKLADVHGISGFEFEAQEVYKDLVKGSVDKFDKDNLGSVIAIKGNKGPKIMIAAHMDEIGFVVSTITKEGFLKLSPIGGWWGHVLLGKPLVVHTRTGKKIRGIVGSTPPHILKPEQRNKVMTPQEMFVDVGAFSEAEVRKAGIKEGDWVVKDSELFQGVNENWISGKSLDDRACVAVMVEIMKNLEGVNHPNQVFATSTVQEEVGLRGAMTSAFHINPDIAFAIDVCIAKDTPGLPKGCVVGKGPAISIRDGSVIGHPKLRYTLEEVAEKHGIPFQFDVMEAGGTDAGTIHKVHSGVPTVTLSLPSRYIHSHYEVVSLEDMKNCAALITAFIKDFSTESMKKMDARRIL